MKPKRALLTIANMGASLNIDNVSRSEAADFARGISNITSSAVADYERWLRDPARRVGDYYPISDTTGDEVAVVVVLP